ncbi:MAG: polysaccharide deacetylase family protein [Nitrosopumilus sp.]|nr:polysaccharide deacetylase family protein [Nitrosopumilus sp.]
MIKIIFLFLFLGIFLIPSLSDIVYAEEISIQLELTYPNGDRMSLGNSKIQINSEDKEVNLELIGKHSEHYFKTELPFGKNYKILVYSNDMLVGTKYFSLEKKIYEVIKIPVNPSIGMKFFTYYNDGRTPIENAVLKIYSHKGNEIQTTKTDAEGKTQRFWLPATISEGDFYQVQVSIDDSIVYEYSSIRLASGSHDFKIVTDWPDIVDYITIRTTTGTTSNHFWGENYFAEIYNKKEFKKSLKFNRGVAHISELTVGKYEIFIFEEKNPFEILARTEISIDGSSLDYNISLDNTPISRKNLGYPQIVEYVNLPKNNPQDLNNPSNLTWIKQSSSGIQKINNNSDYFLELETEGNGKVVFTRSKSFEPFNLFNNEIQLTYKIDQPSSVNEFWIYFSNDNFENSWYTLKIPNNSIPINKKSTQIFDLLDADITGKVDPTKITQIQFRIKDQSNEKINLQISELKIIDLKDSMRSIKNVEKKSSPEPCNCVAFRLDDIQDHFLDDVQMEIINSFLEKDVELTIGVIGDKIGNDQKLVSYLKYNKNNPYLKFANHGWEHEDFSHFSKENQEMLILRTNEKITTLFGVESKVFIPPFNSYNEDTISALKSLKFTHLSSELDAATPPFPLSGQKLYHFPETAFTGDLNKDDMKFLGVSHQTTLKQINESIEEFGFAVVTLHPQEFSKFYDGSYQNEINPQQFKELNLLLSKLKDENIKITFLDEINSEYLLVPTWLKHNAKWWAEEKINDITFVNGIHFLIDEDIIQVNPTEQNESNLTQIPSWIKNNARWWSEDLLSDEEFVKSIQYLINQRIISI